MPRKYEEPITVIDERGDKRTSHPAFGAIGAYRVSGHTALHGSDFMHHNYVTIKISAADILRTGSHDHYFSGKQIIEVALSEAQWASFVSSMNVGSGVPCTLDWIIGDGSIPGLPNPKPSAQEFENDANEYMVEAIDEMRKMLAEIDGYNLSGKRTKALKEHAKTAISRLENGLPWVAQSFVKHMEGTIEKAKTEVNAYATNLLQRIGLDNVPKPPIEITGPEKDDG